MGLSGKVDMSLYTNLSESDLRDATLGKGEFPSNSTRRVEYVDTCSFLG